MAQHQRGKTDKGRDALPVIATGVGITALLLSLARTPMDMESGLRLLILIAAASLLLLIFIAYVVSH